MGQYGEGGRTPITEHSKTTAASWKWLVLAIPLLVALAAAIAWPRPGPASANPLTGIADVSAGSSHTCALTASGGVKCWGANWAGQLGQETTQLCGFSPCSTTLVDVTGRSSGVAAVSAGGSHTCALNTAGGLKCWGDNFAGGLGDGTTTQRTAPVDVAGLSSGVTAVSAGSSHTCALTTAGGVKCWGANWDGQLGNATTEECSDGKSFFPCSTVPVDVSGLSSDVAAVSAGGSHTCALTTAGGVKCWGANWDGQLGDGTTTGSTTPVDAAGLASGVAAVSAGGSYTCALTTAGGVKCWGANWAGQLGDGTTTSRTTPVDVSGLASGVVAVSGWSEHTCALTTAGAVKCWGDNWIGQLGDGTITHRTTPVDVSGLASGVAALDVGGAHTCAVTTAGGVKCWGSNFSGELGDGTTRERSTPVDVLGVVKPPALLPGAGTCDPTGPPETGNFDRTIVTSDGREREYLLHVPPSYTGADALPLVFYLHGTSGTTHQGEHFGLAAKADEAGFILVSPQGTATSFVTATHWNFTMLEQFIAPETPNDVAFIAELLDTLESELCVDAARVYATGMSSRGLMSSRVGCSLDDRVAAVAPISGIYFPPFSTDLLIEPACDTTRPVPIIAFHGTADRCIVFEAGVMDCSDPHDDPYGNIGLRLRGVEDEILPDWAAHNGCATGPNVDRPAENLHVVRYQDCDQGADVVLYAFEGGPHAFYERDPGWEEISSVDLIWEFFLAHPMPAAQEPAPTPTPTPASTTAAPQPAADVLPIALPATGAGGSSGSAGAAGWPAAVLAAAIAAGAIALGGAAWWMRR